MLENSIELLDPYTVLLEAIMKLSEMPAILLDNIVELLDPSAVLPENFVKFRNF